MVVSVWTQNNYSTLSYYRPRVKSKPSTPDPLGRHLDVKCISDLATKSAKLHVVLVDLPNNFVSKVPDWGLQTPPGVLKHRGSRFTVTPTINLWCETLDDRIYRSSFIGPFLSSSPPVSSVVVVHVYGLNFSSNHRRPLPF